MWGELVRREGRGGERESAVRGRAQGAQRARRLTSQAAARMVGTTGASVRRASARVGASGADEADCIEGSLAMSWLTREAARWAALMSSESVHQPNAEATAVGDGADGRAVRAAAEKGARVERDAARSHEDGRRARLDEQRAPRAPRRGPCCDTTSGAVLSRRGDRRRRSEGCRRWRWREKAWLRGRRPLGYGRVPLHKCGPAPGRLDAQTLPKICGRTEQRRATEERRRRAQTAREHGGATRLNATRHLEWHAPQGGVKEAGGGESSELARGTRM